MQAIKLDQRALDPLHALRVEPFLALISPYPVHYDPSDKAFVYEVSVTEFISALMLSGHMPMAVSLRDSFARKLLITYSQERMWVRVECEGIDGHPSARPGDSIVPGLSLVVIALYRGTFDSDISKADRYTRVMSKLLFRAPELLINAAHNGYRYKVRTDIPPVDLHLLEVLDRTSSQANRMVLALRVARLDTQGTRTEVPFPAVSVARNQPLRHLAVAALSKFIHSQQAQPAISIRGHHDEESPEERF